MRLSSLLMFAVIKAPHINGIMWFSNHYFAFYVSDSKQYTSINGFNSNIWCIKVYGVYNSNIYGVRKDLISGCHLFLTFISGL